MEWNYLFIHSLSVRYGVTFGRSRVALPHLQSRFKIFLTICSMDQLILDFYWSLTKSAQGLGKREEGLRKERFSLSATAFFSIVHPLVSISFKVFTQAVFGRETHSPSLLYGWFNSSTCLSHLYTSPTPLACLFACGEGFI